MGEMTVDTIDVDFEGKSKTPIQKFYDGKAVFITGGTGFLGKMLIEKLVRTCTDLDRIYVLVRPNKSCDATQRVESIFDDPVFDAMKTQVPTWREKIVPLSGDCAKPGLGLSEIDRATLRDNITAIFHLAATIRFNEKLKTAVNINVGGTKELLEMGRDMKKLKAFVHVSTAFSNCIHEYVEEKFYEPPIKGDTLLTLVESLKEKDLDIVTDKLIGDFPNTYAFTKCIAEDVVREYGKFLPIGVFRPAIVISSYREPTEGWCCHLYGPNGICVGAAAGLVRVINVDLSKTAQIVPVDLTVNALIAIAWEIGNKQEKGDTEVPIYNYSSSWNNRLTWETYMSEAFRMGRQIPIVQSMWYLTVTSTKRVYLYNILSFILHIIPAIFIDSALILTGQKPRLLKAYRKIHKYVSLTSYFCLRDWTFSNPNTQKLWEKLDESDRKLFYFSLKDFDWEDYIYKYIHGLRLYMFHEDISTLPVAQKRTRKFMYLHFMIKYTVLVLLMWLFYRFLCFIYNSLSTTL